MLLLLFVGICHLSFLKAQNSTSLDNRWYGPSYSPSWWNPDDDAVLRQGEFSYEGSNAPSSWSKKFSECGGRKQSPINIVTSSLEKRKTRKPLLWNNYSNTPSKMELENSKYSIHIKSTWRNEADTPFITNGPLQNHYQFSQLHFHWGKDSFSGSEHTVNGKMYPLEMHVVHDRNVSRANNLSDGSPGIVVVGFVFEVTRKDNPALRPIVNKLKNIEGSMKKKTNIQAFPLDSLVNTFSGDYVTYKGSLTTPPCTEDVVWIISSTPLSISESQLVSLRKSVRDERGKNLQNFRPVQNINGRSVYYVHC